MAVSTGQPGNPRINEHVCMYSYEVRGKRTPIDLGFQRQEWSGANITVCLPGVCGEL